MWNRKPVLFSECEKLKSIYKNSLKDLQDNQVIFFLLFFCYCSLK